MDRSRLIMALALSLVVLMSWPLVMHYLAPQPIEEPLQLEEPPPQRPAETKPQPPPSVSIAKKPESPSKAALPSQAPPQTTQVGLREITITSKGETDSYWHATLSNRGAVATSWI